LKKGEMTTNQIKPMKTDKAAADASNALGHLLSMLDDKTQLAKDVRAMIRRLDGEFNLFTIGIGVEENPRPSLIDASGVED
jgi:hypothetical protein